MYVFPITYNNSITFCCIEVIDMVIAISPLERTRNRGTVRWKLLSIVVYFFMLFSVTCLHTITIIFYLNYRYIFTVLLQDTTGYREFTILYENAWILLNQTATHVDAYKPRYYVLQ